MVIKEINVNELATWLASATPPLLIDVRTPQEMAEAAIAKAKPLLLDNLPIRADEVPRDEPVVFYCRSGNRSGQACLFMMQRGYENVYNLRGGMLSWIQAELPVQPLIV